MNYRSITFKLMAFLVLSGIFFSALSNQYISQFLLEEYSSELHDKNEAILMRLTDDFRASMREVEGTVNTLTILTEDRFIRDGLLMVPNMNEEEVFYETLLTRYLSDTKSASGSIYIYFDPELDGDSHDVWMHSAFGGINREEEIPLQRYIDRDNMGWFYGPRDSGISGWIEPYTNRFDEYITSYVSPVFAKGQFIGIIGMYLELDYLTSQMEDLQYNEGDIFWAINREGGVIYHSNYEEGTPYQSFFQWQRGQRQYDAIMSGARYYTYARTTQEGWQFFYSVPARVIDEARSALRFRVIVIFVTVTLLLLTLLWFITRRYRNRFGQIISTLEEIGKGNIDLKLDVKDQDEIGMMAKAINTSNESLIATIEEKNDLAFNHQVSGLPNRQCLVKALERRFEDTGDLFSMIYLDIDEFTKLNDLMGYQAGDAFIRMISEIIANQCNGDLKLYHVTIDEFVMVTDQQWNQKMLYDFSVRLLQNFGKNIEFMGHVYFVTTSIGIVQRDEQVKALEDLFKAADMALAAAREKGRNSLAFYEKSMFRRLVLRNIFERDFAQALKEDRFILHYQPQVDLWTKEVVGAEALVRWDHQEKGLIYPETFIEFAEKFGLISELGDVVLHKVCQQIVEWRDAGEPERIVSVNLSMRQLADMDFNERIIGILSTYNVDPTQLALEITEKMFIGHDDAFRSKIKRLKTAGFQIVLDDFGTGYSSLESISNLPIDVLKIDQSLVNRCIENNKMEILLRAIVDMTQALKCKVIAEGVETRIQLTVFEGLGCDQVQGFYFSRPVPPKDYLAYIKEVDSGHNQR